MQRCDPLPSPRPFLLGEGVSTSSVLWFYILGTNCPHSLQWMVVSLTVANRYVSARNMTWTWNMENGQSWGDVTWRWCHWRHCEAKFSFSWFSVESKKRCHQHFIGTLWTGTYFKMTTEHNATTTRQDNLLSPWQPEAGLTSLLSFSIKR